MPDPNDLDAYLNPPAPRPRRGMKLSPDEISSTLRTAGWDERHVPTMTAIAQAESSGNPLAHNPKHPDDSYGLWQVNRLAHPEFSPDTLRDPVGNAKAALNVFRDKKQGFGAWSVYRSGAYKRYLRDQSSPQQKPTSDLGTYLDPQPPGQTPPPTSVSTSATSPAEQSVPSLTAALDALTASTNAATERVKRQAARTPRQPPRNPLMERYGQQRALDQQRRQQEEDTRQQVIAERRGRRAGYGAPTGAGILHLVSNPLTSFQELFRPEEENVALETQERLRQQAVAADPEVTAIRREYGRMPAAARTVAAPLLRGGASLLSTAGGLAELGGALPKGAIPPLDKLSEWARRRAEIIEAGAAGTPLQEKRGLTSLITGDPELEEIQRGIPEKVATGIADLGVGLGQIVLLKRATRLPFNQLLALEAAAKNSNKPVAEQLARAGEGYALGTALERYTGRAANAALSAVPTAAQTGYEVSQGRMSPVDAAIQTGIQGAAGAILTNPRAGKQQATRSAINETPRGEAVTPEFVERNRRILSDAEFREHLFTESVGGNAGEGRAAVNVVLDPDGRIIRFGNEPIGELPSLIQERLRKGEYSRAALVFKDALTENPQPERLVLHSPAVTSDPRDLQGEWFVDFEDPSRSRGNIPLEMQEIQRRAVRRQPEIEEYLDESQVQAKPPVATQRAEVESAEVASTVGTGNKVSQLEDAAVKVPVPVAEIGPQRFFHKDFDVVTESPNQKRVGKGRVRVVAEDGTEHIIKRSSMTGAGNQRAVPIREVVPEPDINKYLDPAEPAAVPPATSPAREVAPAASMPRGVRAEETVTEPVIKPPSDTTAAKNAAMAADRAELGLPELERSAGRSAQRVLDDAIARNAQNPRQSDILIEQALHGARNFTDTETMQVNLRAVEVKKEIARLKREVAVATDDTIIADKSVELNARIDEFDRLSQAQRAAGTEWGRAGLARQQGVDFNLNLIEDVVADFRAEAKRRETSAERVEIEQLRKQNEALSTKLAEANDRLATKRIQDDIDKSPSRRQRQQRTAEALDKEWDDLTTQLATIKAARTEGFFKSESGELDPAVAKLAAKMARNRVLKGVNKAERLVDEVYQAVRAKFDDVTEREIRDAISGYSVRPKITRSEAQRQLNALKSELQGLSRAEDITAGRRSPRQEGPQGVFKRDQARQRTIEKQIADLEQRIPTSDFSESSRPKPLPYTRETAALQRQIDDVRLRYEQMKYRATASTGRKALDEATKAVNVSKTLLSIGDISAVFRQGGFYSITHPKEGLLKPTRAMLQSFTDAGYRNVEQAIRADPAYETLKKVGVDFTGVERKNPHLSAREEGFLGGDYIDFLARGKYNLPGKALKGVKDFSERTFVSFLDAQRLSMGRQMMAGMTETQRRNPQELKAVASLLNAGTGRGNLGARGNAAAPVLNLGIFSPRLLVSRIQLLNNMISPRKLATMPPAARKRMIQDNVKFIAATMTALALASQIPGVEVNLDPDDSDFLKIRAGNTTWDTLIGLQQPLRFFINMGRAVAASVTGDETYAGPSRGETAGRFARSKLSPSAGAALNYIVGEDMLGRKPTLKTTAKDLLTPLPARDIIEAAQKEGLAGAIKATPTFAGIGVGSYPPPPERPRTHAEKLSRKLIREKMPDVAREEEQIEVDQQKADLRARSRRGEEVKPELMQLLRAGSISKEQAQRVVQARGRTRLSEDIKRLSADDALTVYSVMSADEKRVSAATIRSKIANSKADAAKKQRYKQRARELGLVQ